MVEYVKTDTVDGYELTYFLLNDPIPNSCQHLEFFVLDTSGITNTPFRHWINQNNCFFVYNTVASLFSAQTYCEVLDTAYYSLNRTEYYLNNFFGRFPVPVFDLGCDEHVGIRKVKVIADIIKDSGSSSWWETYYPLVSQGESEATVNDTFIVQYQYRHVLIREDLSMPKLFGAEESRLINKCVYIID